MELTRGAYVTDHRAADPTGAGGRAARRAQRWQAFLPRPLAGWEPNLDGATAADISDAETALARLASRPLRQPAADALSLTLLRSEAIASSWIEAITTSHRRLAEAAHGATGARHADAARVVAAVEMVRTAVDDLASPDGLDVEGLCRLHHRLLGTSPLRADRERAGRLRDEPVFIGGVSPATADYVPPPAQHVPALMDDLVSFVRDRHDLSPIVRAGIGHAQFETIHPFHDGNGRVGRALVHAVLRASGLSGPLLTPLSLVLAASPGDYVDGLTAYRHDDDRGWLSWFAVSTSRATGLADRLVDDVLALVADWRVRVDDARRATGRRALRRDSAASRLLDALPGMGVLRADDVMRHLDVSGPAARAAIAELEQAGVLTQTTLGRRNRVHEARELFALLDDSTRLDPPRF